jgi:glucose dehydrogenase
MTAVLAAVVLAVMLCGPASAADWPTGGQNLQNSRFQAAETSIGAGNAQTLAEHWRFTTGGDVSATPTVDGNLLFFPDSAGNLFAVDRATGLQVWRSSIAAATGFQRRLRPGGARGLRPHCDHRDAVGQVRVRTDAGRGPGRVCLGL